MQAYDVLVVTHDAGMLEMLCSSISADPSLHLAGCCGTAGDAVKLAAETSPDVIALDMQLPGADCSRLIGTLQVTGRSAVIAMSAVTGIALQTLDAGADDFVYMPVEGNDSDFGRFLSDAVDRIKIAASSYRGGNESPDKTGRSARIVVIAGAAGGPVPLAYLVSRLPADGPAVIAAQWRSGVFCCDFIEMLINMTKREIVKGMDGIELAPGGVYVVEGNSRVEIVKTGEKLSLRLQGECRDQDEQTSALFLSAAEALENRAAVALLYESKAGEEALHRMAATGTITIKHSKNAILRDIDYKAGGGIVELPLEDIAAEMFS